MSKAAKVSVPLDEPDLGKLDELARLIGVTRQQVLRHALRMMHSRVDEIGRHEMAQQIVSRAST